MPRADYDDDVPFVVIEGGDGNYEKFYSLIFIRKLWISMYIAHMRVHKKMLMYT